MYGESSELFFRIIKESIIGKTSSATYIKNKSESAANQYSNGKSRWAFLFDAMKQDKQNSKEA